jgi:hypothetical protein
VPRWLESLTVIARPGGPGRSRLNHHRREIRAEIREMVRLVQERERAR